MSRQPPGQPPARPQRPQQSRRYGTGEQSIGARGTVPAPEAEITDFVLHLHHEHGLPARIPQRHVMQQCRERCGVRPFRASPEHREDGQRCARGRDGARKTPRIVEHPAWRITRESVLPAAEPQQHQMQVRTARHGDPVIQYRKIEPSLDRLDLIPGHRHQHCVELPTRERRQDRVGRRGGSRRGVLEFPAADQERSAVQDQLRGTAYQTQMRQGSGPRGGACAGAQQADQCRLCGSNTTHRWGPAPNPCPD